MNEIIDWIWMSLKLQKASFWKMVVIWGFKVMLLLKSSVKEMPWANVIKGLVVVIKEMPQANLRVLGTWSNTKAF